MSRLQCAAQRHSNPAAWAHSTGGSKRPTAAQRQWPARWVHSCAARVVHVCDGDATPHGGWHTGAERRMAVAHQCTRWVDDDVRWLRTLRHRG
jgi:hypothetical protein